MTDISDEELRRRLERIRNELLEAVKSSDSAHKPRTSKIGELVLIEVDPKANIRDHGQK